MKNLKSTSLVIVLTAVIALSAYVQKGTFSKVAIADAIPQSGWISYDTIQNVAVFYRVDDCDDVKNGVFSQDLLFKMENLNAQNKKISFNMKLWNNGQEAQNGTDVEHQKSITLKANQSLEGSCDKNPALKVFIGFNDKDKLNLPRLSHFQFTQFDVE